MIGIAGFHSIRTDAQSVLEHKDSIVMGCFVFFNLGSYYVCTQVKGSQYDILKSGVTTAKDLHTILEGILDILCSFCTLQVLRVCCRKTVIVASYAICQSKCLHVHAFC